MYDETGYHPPEWSAVPIEAFNLEVLKDGLIIDTIHLADKAYYTLGRQHDIVDIPMDHPSISRIHAVLNYRSDGSLMLLDLNSAQGTYLNKSICEKNVYHRVYVGDIIKFGASTRKYIVNGPDEQRLPEYNSANLINLREKLQSRSQEIKRKLEQDNECSWGFSDEDYSASSNTVHADGDRNADGGDDEEDSRRSRFRSGDKGLADLPEYLKNDENYDRKYGDKYAISISESSLKNEKDAAIHDKIRVKERKIQNMQEENRRIYMKETSQDNGLTEGQLNAVKRNDVNILHLKNDIDNLVKQLQIKEQDRNRNNNSSSIDGGGVSNGKKRGGGDEDDEEQLLDETSGNIDVETNFRLKKKLKRNQLRFHGADGNGSRAAASSRALSYQDIDSEINSNDIKLSTINEQMNVLNRRIESLVSTIGSDNDGSSAKYSSSNNSNQYRDASIDDIIVTNQIQEYKLKLTALTAEKLELESKRQGLQRLLVIATPALKSLIPKGGSSLTQHEEMMMVVKVEVSKQLATGSSIDNDSNNNNRNGSHNRNDSHHEDTSHAKIMDHDCKGGSIDVVSDHNITTITDHDEAMTSKCHNHDERGYGDKADSSSDNKSIEVEERLGDTLLSATCAAVEQDMLSVDTVTIDAGRSVLDSRSNTSPTASNHGSLSVKKDEHVRECVDKSSAVVEDSNCISHTDDTVHVDQKKSLALPLRAKAISAMSSKVVKVRNEDQLSFKSDVLEGGEYVWIPPKMQTGDGKTSLNAKYGY